MPTVTKKGNVKSDGVKYKFVESAHEDCSHCVFAIKERLCEVAPCTPISRADRGLPMVNGYFKLSKPA